MAVNDAIRILSGTVTTLEGNGSVSSGNGILVADDADLTTALVGGRPYGSFELTVAFSGAPTAGSAIHLYERKNHVGETNQAPVVDSTYKHDYIGTFVPDVAAATQYLKLEGVPICFHGATYYIEWVDTNGTPVNVSAGWILKVTPYTYGPATA